MNGFQPKQTQPPQRTSSDRVGPGAPAHSIIHHENPILNLQHTIGNQAVLRLLQVGSQPGEAASTSGTGAAAGHNFASIPVFQTLARGIQRKLTDNTPGDAYEQEADSMSEQMMRMPAPSANSPDAPEPSRVFGGVGGVKRACACGGTCDACKKKHPEDEHAHLQMKAVGPANAGGIEAPPIIHEALLSPGQPLDGATRAFMEPRFGQGFRGVRVHTDEKAAESATAAQAKAYIVGQNVVFGAGSFAPGTQSGHRLRGHELVHVVQQQGATERPPARIVAGESGSAAEQQAEDGARDLVADPPREQPRLERSMPGVSLEGQEQDAVSCDDRDWHEPNSSAVAAIIDDAYGGSRSSTYPVDELQTAWSHVRNQREKPGGANCCSSELAAAEHYLYARYAVANRDYSPFEMKAMIWGYGYLKYFVPKTGICPKSPDTQGDRDWGYRGADDGATDLFHQELA